MRLRLFALGLLFMGCFQPVDPDGRLVSSCRGSCPYGECDEQCAAGTDASCTTPEDCQRAYRCAKTGAQPCSSYRADFRLGTTAADCAQTNGSYCLTTIGSYGARRMSAVFCSDAGQTSIDCVGDRCADGGTYPAACRGV